jgi:hypothetical protein
VDETRGGKKGEKGEKKGEKGEEGEKGEKRGARTGTWGKGEKIVTERKSGKKTNSSPSSVNFLPIFRIGPKTMLPADPKSRECTNNGRSLYLQKKSGKSAKKGKFMKNTKRISENFVDVFFLVHTD